MPRLSHKFVWPWNQIPDPALGLCFTINAKSREIAMTTIIIILLVLFLIGALPNWNHSANWGYGPSGGLGVVLTILVILWLLGKI